MDTGLNCLVALARFHQLPAEAPQLVHQFGHPGQDFTDTEILQAAKALSLVAKHVRPARVDISNGILPAIAKVKDGSYFVLARLAFDDADGQMPKGALFQDLRAGAPTTLAMDAFLELQSGELILLSMRVGLGESLHKAFDISWFIPSIVEYRKLFADVLLASFFLQIFALVAPFFFQVLMLAVPTEGALEVEVLLEHKDIGFVREGMPAEIKLRTFPFTKYRVIDDEVVNVSDDAIIDEKRGLVYSMRVKLARNTIWVDSREVALMPGMADTAEVQTDKRRIIEFFTSPMQRYAQEGLRER